MNFFNQIRHDLNNSNRYSNEMGEGLYVDVNEIWTQCHESLCEKLNLPELHLWEDGFYQGDASYDALKELTKKYPDLVSVDEEDEWSFIGLNEKFIYNYQERVEKAIEEAKDTETYFA